MDSKTDTKNEQANGRWPMKNLPKYYCFHSGTSTSAMNSNQP